MSLVAKHGAINALILSLCIVYPFIDLLRRLFLESAFIYIIVEILIIIHIFRALMMRWKIKSRVFSVALTLFLMTQLIILVVITTTIPGHATNMIVLIVEAKFFTVLIFACILNVSTNLSIYETTDKTKKTFRKFVSIFILLYTPLAVTQSIFGNDLPDLIKVIANSYRENGGINWVYLSSGPFYVPKRAARYMIILICVLLVHDRKPSMHSFILWGLILLTVSREGIILSTILLGLVTINFNVIKKLWIIIVVGITTAIVLNIKYEGFFFGTTGDWLHRITALLNVFGAIGQYLTPWGFGPDSYSQASNLISYNSSFDRRSFIESNTFLSTVGDSYLVKIAIQYGLVGLILTLIFFTLVVLGTIKCIINNRPISAFSGLALVLLLIKLHLVSTDSFFVIIMFLIFLQGLQISKRNMVLKRII
jgi:hypothetical protein